MKAKNKQPTKTETQVKRQHKITKMKLQSTNHKGKTAVLSQDLFEDNTLQVFNLKTGNYIGLLRTGYNIEELMQDDPVQLKNFIQAIQNKNQLSLF